MQLFNNIKNWAKNSIVDEILIFALMIAIIENIAQNTIKSSKQNSLKFLIPPPNVPFFPLISNSIVSGENEIFTFLSFKTDNSSCLSNIPSLSLFSVKNFFKSKLSMSINTSM